jgi:hypothetical protein
MPGAKKTFPRALGMAQQVATHMGLSRREEVGVLCRRDDEGKKTTLWAVVGSEQGDDRRWVSCA